MRTATTLIAIAAGAFVIGSAGAQSRADITVTAEPVAFVSYGDLNLRTASGVETLNGRVRRAAKQVCGISNGTEPLYAEMNGRTCWRAAVADAQPQIDSAISTFEFAGRDSRITVALKR